MLLGAVPPGVLPRQAVEASARALPKSCRNQFTTPRGARNAFVCADPNVCLTQVAKTQPPSLTLLVHFVFKCLNS